MWDLRVKMWDFGGVGKENEAFRGSNVGSWGINVRFGAKKGDFGVQMKQLRPLGLESRAQMGRNVGFWGLNVRLGARRWAFVTGLEFVRCRAAFWGWDVGEWSGFGVFLGCFSGW